MNSKHIILRFVSVFLSLVTVFLIAAPSFAAGTTDMDANIVDEETKAPVQDRIVEIARAQIGKYDGNINKFTKWYYGYDTDAFWCTIFVSWCGAQAGATGSAVPKRSTVEGMRQWYVSRNRYYPATSDYVPQRGDIVFMNTEVDGTDNVHHVEIITETGFSGSKKNPKISCIGGNTSNLNFEGSEYVTEKIRPVNGSRATIVGYANPPYENCDSLAGLLHTIIDVTSPAFIRYIFSKIISLIQIIQSPVNNTPETEAFEV
ncbi:MAG: CHAP domain-containing protein [Clostridia bacterium]|nr:CHAP domain-containing protein [Clostridia bacterium]